MVFLINSGEKSRSSSSRRRTRTLKPRRPGVPSVASRSTASTVTAPSGGTGGRVDGAEGLGPHGQRHGRVHLTDRAGTGTGPLYRRVSTAEFETRKLDTGSNDIDRRRRRGTHPSIDVYWANGTVSHSDTDFDSQRDDAPPRRTPVTHLYRCVFDATNPPSTEFGDVGPRCGADSRLRARPLSGYRHSCRSVLNTAVPRPFALWDTHRYRCVSADVVTWSGATRPDRPAVCILTSPSPLPATASSSSGCR
jgi:hypothetical protein